MLTADTLTADTAVVNEWLNSGNYDYQRDLANQGETLWQTLLAKLGEWFEQILSDVFNSDGASTLLMILGISVLIVLVFFVLRKVSRIRRNTKTKDLDYEVAEDTIYGIDFDAELKRALAIGDHRGALRMVYLRTLRLLHDEKVLHWDNTLTPEEFVHAIADAELRKEFSMLTTMYVRVRYGHFTATLPDVENAIALERKIRSRIEKGGEG